MENRSSDFGLYFTRLPFLAIDKSTGKIMEVNNKILEVLGYKQKEILGKKVECLFSPEGDYSLKKFMSEFDYDSGEFQNFNWKIRKENSESMNVFVTVKTIFDGERNPIFVFFRDVNYETDKGKSELDLFYGTSGGEEKLKENLRELELILWAADEGFWNWNIPEGTISFSESWMRMLGYSPEKVPNDLIFWLEKIYSEDVDKLISLLKKYLRNEIYGFETEFRFKKPDNSFMWIKLRGKVVNWSDKLEPLRFTGTLKDISHQKETEKRLSLASRVFDENQEAIVITDENFRIRELNRQFESHMSYSINEMQNENLFLVLTDSDGNSMESSITHALKTDKKWQGEVLCKNRDDKVFPAWASISMVRDERGRIQNYLALFTDISQLKQAEAKLNYMAHFDQLTNLPNRTLLYDRIQNGIYMSQRNNHKMAVVFMDIDDFKMINDTMGHFAGDLVLIEVTKRLKAVLRKTDTIARWGGDEFVIVLNDIKKAEQLEIVLEKLRVSFVHPFKILDKVVTISSSIGVAICPEHGGDRETLLKNADIAMYYSKQHGKNKYTIFEEEMKKSVENRMEFEASFGESIEDNQLETEYVPVFNETRELSGVEIIPIWNRPDREAIKSRELLIIAENTGMLGYVEKWALLKTFEKLSDKIGNQEFSIYMKIPFGKLYDSRFLDEIRMIMENGRPKNISVVFEIPESILIQNDVEIMNRIMDLKKTGIKICVDNFGSGFCSFEILKKYEIDFLKSIRFIRKISRFHLKMILFCGQ